MEHKICKALLLASTLIISTVSATYAEYDGSLEPLFTFRDIPWYTERADAEHMLQDEGAKKCYESSNIYRLGLITHIDTVGKDGLILYGGGCNVSYLGLTVAGYTPSSVHACYLYQIDKDGVLDRTDSSAQFYTGWYDFEKKDFPDMGMIYNDLLNKLTSLYGNGDINPAESNPHFWSISWTDSEENLIMLSINGMKDNIDKEINELTLVYTAEDADERLDAVQEILDAEAIAEEAEQVEGNKDNTSGL